MSLKKILGQPNPFLFLMLARKNFLVVLQSHKNNYLFEEYSTCMLSNEETFSVRAQFCVYDKHNGGSRLKNNTLIKA